jgi:hypothetical protein
MTSTPRVALAGAARSGRRERETGHNTRRKVLQLPRRGTRSVWHNIVITRTNTPHGGTGASTNCTCKNRANATSIVNEGSLLSAPAIAAFSAAFVVKIRFVGMPVTYTVLPVKRPAALSLEPTRTCKPDTNTAYLGQRVNEQSGCGRFQDRVSQELSGSEQQIGRSDDRKRGRCDDVRRTPPGSGQWSWHCQGVGQRVSIRVGTATVSQHGHRDGRK